MEIDRAIEVKRAIELFQEVGWDAFLQDARVWKSCDGSFYPFEELTDMHLIAICNSQAKEAKQVHGSIDRYEAENRGMSHWYDLLAHWDVWQPLLDEMKRRNIYKRWLTIQGIWSWDADEVVRS